MSLEPFSNSSRAFSPERAVQAVGHKALARTAREVAAFNLRAIVESHKSQGRAYVNQSDLDAVGILSEATADRYDRLVKRIAHSAPEHPWAAEGYADIMRSFLTAADRIIQRQVEDR